MRHVDVFCGSYDLKTGTRLIAWFYIVIYLFNIFINIFALDIVKAYKDNVNEDLKYDETSILAFHYICLTFGILTILLSAAVLVKLSDESEYFLKFIVKWNVFRCFFTFAGIIYVCAAMNEILTVSISCVFLAIDLCASTYFTGIMASFVKQIEDPYGQEMSIEKHSEIHLISHKKSLYQHEVTVINETTNTSLSEAAPTNATVAVDVNRGITNKTVDEEVKQETKVNKSPSSTEDSKMETKGLQLETVESTIDLHYASVSSEDPGPTPEDEKITSDSSTSQETQHSPSNDTGPVDPNQKSDISEQQNEETKNEEPKTTDEVSNNIAHCDPKFESLKSDEVQDPDIGTTNPVAQANDMDDQTGTEASVANPELDTKASKDSSDDKGVDNHGLDAHGNELPAVQKVPESPEN